THYVEELKNLSFTKATLDQPVLVTVAGALLCFLFPPIFFATLGIVCFLSSDLRRLYGSFAVVVLFAFSYSFGNCLITAIVHSLDVTGYIIVQYSFVLLSSRISAWGCPTFHARTREDSFMVVFYGSKIF